MPDRAASDPGTTTADPVFWVGDLWVSRVCDAYMRVRRIRGRS